MGELENKLQGVITGNGYIILATVCLVDLSYCVTATTLPQVLFVLSSVLNKEM